MNHERRAFGLLMASRGLEQPWARRAEVQRAAIAYWIAIGEQCLARTQPSPPRAARSMAVLATALHDGLVHGLGATEIDARIRRLLPAMFPLAVVPGIIESVGGTAVDGLLPASFRADGAAHAPPRESLSVEEPGAADVWQPTPHLFAVGEEPGWGRVRPQILPHASSCRAPAPPAWSSAACAQIRTAFLHAQPTSARQRATAWRWNLAARTGGVIGYWFRLGRILLGSARCSARMFAQSLATLGIALHDACIACWESKYHYRWLRPIQWMRRTTPSWWPVITTPAHPAYPSAHAVLAGAASTVLGAALPSAQHDLARAARHIAAARVVAGVHWPIDGAAGLVMGQQVAALVLADRRMVRILEAR
jgi:membrane-associated phospholipid phosphatase